MLIQFLVSCLISNGSLLTDFVNVNLRQKASGAGESGLHGTESKGETS